MSDTSSTTDSLADTNERYQPTRHIPKQARAKERVRQILAGTSQSLREIGVEKTTTNSIAEKSNLPVGSIYKYFQDKRSILESLYDLYTTDLAAKVKSITKDPLIPTDTPEQFINALVAEWTEYSRINHPIKLRNYLMSEPIGAKHVAMCHQRIIKSLSEAITQNGYESSSVSAKAVALLSILCAHCELGEQKDTTVLAAQLHLKVAAIQLLTSTPNLK